MDPKRSLITSLVGHATSWKLAGLRPDRTRGVWVLTEKGKHHSPVDIEAMKKSYMERVSAESDDSEESLERALPDSLEDELWYAMAARALIDHCDEIDAAYDD